MAVRIGLSESAPTYWKRGSLPSSDAIAKLADELECSADYLLGRTDKPDAGLSAAEESLLYYFSFLDDFEKGEFLGQIKDRTRERVKEKSAALGASA
jgi:transcriptional regulator with XRE-family HTH domain